MIALCVLASYLGLVQTPVIQRRKEIRCRGKGCLSGEGGWIGSSRQSMVKPLPIEPEVPEL